MSADPIRLLLVSDTHLGFDLAFNPRLERRRRGPDFFANFRTSLEPALRGEVDLVVHGGDLFYRSRVRPALVEMALEPLLEVARGGVPVYLVPGNHERSRIPQLLWSAHPNLDIFDRPRTFLLDVRRTRLALSGFPFTRRIRDSFRVTLEQTGYTQVDADLRLLCLHQTVAGARVGPAGFTFRSGFDVIRPSDLSPDFDFVLGGHIHRAQLLTRDLSGRPLPCPVVYPGSVERTAFAERNEEKGYYRIELDPDNPAAPETQATFIPLPARPMHMIQVRPEQLGKIPPVDFLARQIATLPPDAVVALRLEGPPEWIQSLGLSASLLRQLAPPTMNISLSGSFRQPNRRRQPPTRPDNN